MPDRELDDLAELSVLLVLEADIAGIDPVFRQRLRTGRMVAQQLVADIVEVADQRHVDAEDVEPLADMRYGRRRLVAIDRDPYQLRAGARQCRDLSDRRRNVGSIGIGHRLYDDRRTAADLHMADHDRDGALARRRRGVRPFGQAGQRLIAHGMVRILCRQRLVAAALRRCRIIVKLRQRRDNARSGRRSRPPDRRSGSAGPPPSP
jgi:hypothetical protein